MAKVYGQVMRSSIIASAIAVRDLGHAGIAEPQPCFEGVSFSGLTPYLLSAAWISSLRGVAVAQFFMAKGYRC